MPDNNNNKTKKSIDSKIDALANNLNGIYKDNYASDPTNKDEINRISDDIYNKIDNILSNNTSIQGIPNVTQLYTRIRKGQNSNKKDNDEIMNGMEELIGTKDLSSMIVSNPDLNRYIKVKDLQVDMVLKYMPKLLSALSIKKDNVLSSDSFSKDSIFACNDSASSKEKETLFAQRHDEIKEIYKIEELFEEIYDDTAKYGEYFLYKVPYKKALSRLMKGPKGSSQLIESVSIIESGKLTEDNKIKIPEKIDLSNTNVRVNFNQKGVIEEAVRNYERAGKIIQEADMSLSEEFIGEASGNFKGNKIFDSDLEYDNLYSKANDGLTTVDKTNSTLTDIPGCVVRKLKRENVIPIYIENICLGYYYIEFKTGTDDIDRNKALLTNSMDKSVSSEFKDDNDYIVKYIANSIAQRVDEKFINANQDLKEEIYIMLKYNDKFNVAHNTTDINVTFLPPEDVCHFYFELDKETHRGISDLDRSLTPAMFWCLLELSTTIGIVTRTQDKRIYYVKQNVETNVARTLLNVINQLKKGNMGIRQMESMNNILGIVGKYNDHVIPTGQSGDAPIQFEVMQGQQIETPTELMNKYEENAVNATDVPLELVNSTDQLDYAIRFTMANSKFLRKVFKRQAQCQRKFGEIYTAIYNYQYGENEKITIMLPPPAFLSMTNGAQLLNNTKEYVLSLADLEYSSSNVDEDEKQEFIRLMVHHLMPTYIDVDLIEEMKSKAKINLAASKSTIDTNASDPDMSNDEM